MHDSTLPKTSFLIKFIECFLSAFAVVNIYNSLILSHITNKFEESSQMLNLMRLCDVFLVISCAGFAIIYPFIWHVNENKGKIISVSRHTFFRAIIRFWLAIMICTYAFAKILETQFSRDLVRENSLAKNLSGFDLTWFYFSYSYPFSLTIALFQLTGAILLLFRKTVFLGVLILLPVMLNIVLINIFYKINDVAKMNANFLTIGLLFLLSLFWNETKHVLIRTSKTLFNLKIKNFSKYIFRIIAVGYAFLVVYDFSITKTPKFLVGKWTVETLIKGGDTIQSNAWLKDSTAWKNIYLDNSGNFTVNPNPYVIERKRAQKGQFHYDVNSQTLSLLFGTRRNIKDHIYLKVIKTDKNYMKWTGEHQGKPLQVNLLKD